MSFLAALGWVIFGAVVVSCLVAFWDDIKDWLNYTAADFVERHLGYNARVRMQKAVSRVTRIGDKLFNRTIVYTRKSAYDDYYDKTTMEADDHISNIDQDVLEELRKANNELLQQFEYKN